MKTQSTSKAQFKFSALAFIPLLLVFPKSSMGFWGFGVLGFWGLGFRV